MPTADRQTTTEPTRLACTDVDGPGFDAAVGAVVEPGAGGHGTLRLTRTDDFDSLDPGNTYYGYTWNFLRLLGRTLVTFRTAPGAAGQELVPDLAESLGEARDGGRTWVYRLREGLRYEDGTAVTAADVKHAIARSNYGTDVLGAGPMYFRQLLGTTYGGPWREPDVDGPTTIEVPDERTIVFRLDAPLRLVRPAGHHAEHDPGPAARRHRDRLRPLAPGHGSLPARVPRPGRAGRPRAQPALGPGHRPGAPPPGRPRRGPPRQGTPRGRRAGPRR